MEKQDRSPQRALIVIEQDTAFLVVSADDNTDWVVCFQKSPDFPARDWAERMVSLYHLRQSSLASAPQEGKRNERSIVR
jgi:hypothetical protein